MARGAILIINKKSRYVEPDLSSGLELLEEHGIPLVQRIETQDPSAISGIIKSHRGRIDRVILGGGDGTMNHAAGPVLETGYPLGILPMGTANDLARTLQIPTSIREALLIIARGKIRRIDLGRVNGRLFFNVAHIGLGAKVTQLIDRESKSRWGALAYARKFIAALTNRRTFRTSLQCNGETRRFRSVEVAVGNGRHYAGGLIVTEGAEIEDGKLHVYFIKPRSLWKMLPAVPAFRKGRAEREWISYLHCRQVFVRTSRNLPIAVDGELVTHTPARFEILEKIFPVFVPDGGSDT